MFSFPSFFIFIRRALKIFRFGSIASHFTGRKDDDTEKSWNSDMRKLVLKY
uniref:Uncharacterized protein n=1 Tax=Solanum tuberosum TaxID=4113 RepID=M1B513_SOLTU